MDGADENSVEDYIWIVVNASLRTIGFIKHNTAFVKGHAPDE